MKRFSLPACLTIPQTSAFLETIVKALTPPKIENVIQSDAEPRPARSFEAALGVSVKYKLDGKCRTLQCSICPDAKLS